MESKECFYRDQFGYCWQEGGQWLFQAVDVTEAPVGEPIKVELGKSSSITIRMKNCISGPCAAVFPALPNRSMPPWIF